MGIQKLKKAAGVAISLCYKRRIMKPLRGLTFTAFLWCGVASALSCLPWFGGPSESPVNQGENIPLAAHRVNEVLTSKDLAPQMSEIISAFRWLNGESPELMETIAALLPDTVYSYYGPSRLEWATHWVARRLLGITSFAAARQLLIDDVAPYMRLRPNRTTNRLLRTYLMEYPLAPPRFGAPGMTANYIREFLRERVTRFAEMELPNGRSLAIDMIMRFDEHTEFRFGEDLKYANRQVRKATTKDQVTPQRFAVFLNDFLLCGFESDYRVALHKAMNEGPQATRQFIDKHATAFFDRIGLKRDIHRRFASRFLHFVLKNDDEVLYAGDDVASGFRAMLTREAKTLVDRWEKERLQDPSPVSSRGATPLAA